MDSNMDSYKVGPIRLIDRQGNNCLDPLADSCNAIPVMDVYLTSPDGSIANRKPYVALVDTGADTCIAPASILDSVGATRGRPMQQTTASGSSVVYLAETVMFFPSMRLNFTTDFTAVSDIGSTAYQLIIGRTFLQHGLLIMDYPNRIFEWRLP